MATDGSCEMPAVCSTRVTGTPSGPGQRLEDRQGGQDITEHDSERPLCCLCPYRWGPGQRARRFDLVIQFLKRMWRWRPDLFAPNRGSSLRLLSTQYREVGIAYFVHLGQFLSAHTISGNVAVGVSDQCCCEGSTERLLPTQNKLLAEGCRVLAGEGNRANDSRSVKVLYTNLSTIEGGNLNTTQY